jgi:hypothetical protein
MRPCVDRVCGWEAVRISPAPHCLVNACHFVCDCLPGVPGSNQGMCRICSRQALSRAHQCVDENLDQRILVVGWNQPTLRRTYVEVEERWRPAGTSGHDRQSG